MTPRSTITHALPAGAEHPTEGRAKALCSLSVRADQVVGSLNATCKRCQKRLQPTYAEAMRANDDAARRAVDDLWAELQALQ